MIQKENACCFTGHRILSATMRENLGEKLEQMLLILTEQGITDFICGGARGFDTLAAQMVLEIREDMPQVRLILALPCREQAKLWNEKEHAEWEAILRQADEVIYTAEEYSTGCMMQRNRFMVDNSDICVYYLTNMRSGTCKTVQYALEQEKNLINILEEIK